MSDLLIHFYSALPDARSSSRENEAIARPLRRGNPLLPMPLHRRPHPRRGAPRRECTSGAVGDGSRAHAQGEGGVQGGGASDCIDTVGRRDPMLVSDFCGQPGNAPFFFREQ
jgi:hypothetical protein